MKRFCFCSAVVVVAFAHRAQSDDTVLSTTVERAAADTIRDVYGDVDDEELDNLPIGLFDSGTGGLTVLEQVLSLDTFDNTSHRLSLEGDGTHDFQNESFIFLADQANMPYGNYPVVGKEDFLDDLIVKDAWFLMGRDCHRFSVARNEFERQRKPPVKAIVIACNTATAYGQPDIETVIRSAGLDIKVVGVIDAGAKGAVELLKDGRPGSLAVVPTRGTVLSGAYPVAIRRNAEQMGLRQRIEVFQQGAFGLAGAIDGSREFILVEAGDNSIREDYRGPAITNPEARIDPTILPRYAFDFSSNRMLVKGAVDDPTELQLNSVENYIAYHLVTLLESIRNAEDPPPLKGIVLGCTHFPFYRDVFQKELKRLRDYRENGSYVYRDLLADEVAFIDPAYFTARALYESLAHDGRMRARTEPDRAGRGEFFITIPCREQPSVSLNESGGFTYDYKYGRDAEVVDSDFRAVPLDGQSVDAAVLERLRQRVPSVWALMSNGHALLDAETERRINQIEELIGEDIGNRRGIGPLVEFNAGGLLAAARSIAEHPRPNVGIITGFYFPYAKPPSCETDGPPGAAHIALAMHNAGIPCRVATDRLNEPVVLASLWGAGLPGEFPVDTVSMDDGEDGGKLLVDVIDAWRHAEPPITHVIAVERGGPAADGRPHNFSGDDISQWNAPLDRLFSAGDWTTIGIGDGGNEIGMGNVPFELIAENVRNGERVACAVKCDHLILCGTSNWGGWALPLSIGLLRPDLRDAMLSGVNRETDYRILQVAVQKGRAAALESFSAQVAYPTMSVDALEWSIHGDKLDEILEAAGFATGDQ